MTQNRPAESPRDHALHLAEIGRDLASILDDRILAEMPDDAEVLTIYAHRLRLCSQPGNIWTGTDLHTPDGELYNGSGRFWTCGAKLCTSCLSRQVKRNRRHLRHITENLKIPVGQNLYFLTLTQVNLGLPLIESRRVMNFAWALFRKRKWFRETILGGCKSEEFTLTPKGYHYHIHGLLQARYVDYSAFRSTWTQCLRSAFEHIGRPLNPATADGLIIASMSKITSIKSAILEVAKYITKTDTWTKIPAQDLLDICRIKRFPRMFELLGNFRLFSDPIAGDEAETSVNKTILVEECISDGGDSPPWRQNVELHGAAEYLDTLRDQYRRSHEIRREQLKRHYPYARFSAVPQDYHQLDTNLRARLELIRETKLHNTTKNRRFRYTYPSGIEWL